MAPESIKATTKAPLPSKALEGLLLELLRGLQGAPIELDVGPPVSLPLDMTFSTKVKARIRGSKGRLTLKIQWDTPPQSADPEEADNGVEELKWCSKNATCPRMYKCGKHRRCDRPAKPSVKERSPKTSHSSPVKEQPL